MEVIIRRIEKEIIFAETYDGDIYGVPRELFENPSVGDIYVIRKIITGDNRLSVFDTLPE